MTSPRLRPGLIAAALLLALQPAPVHSQPSNLNEITIQSAQEAMAAGTLSCRALVQHYLDRIAAYDQQGPTLNAVQHVNRAALAVADSLDTARRAGAPRGSLHCVPVLVKDQVETRDMPTSYGSVLFKDFIPERDATIVTRMREAGAVILAKTTMGEFAQRYVGSAFGIIRNAYDPTRNPSGSSGGSASAVAANFGLVGIGEDTGGSIRGPAAVSNLVGLRPTLELVSRFGMLPANPTQDVLGPMTRTVSDAARLLDVIAGYDPNDPITAAGVGRMPTSYLAELRPDRLRGVRIGVLRTPRDTAREAKATVRDTTISADSVAVLDSIARYRAGEYRKVLPVVETALDALRALGAVVVDSLSTPTVSERSVGNNFETEEATDRYLAEHPNAPVTSLKEILLSGTVTPWRARSMMGYVGKTRDDDDYLALMLYREALRTAVLKLMADHELDALVYATFDAAPTPIADDVLTNPRPVDGYGLGDNRGLSPTLGYPALTVPAGFTSDALPVGLEFLGRPFSEGALFGFGYAFEQATGHRRLPSTTPPLAPR